MTVSLDADQMAHFSAVATRDGVSLEEAVVSAINRQVQICLREIRGTR